MTTSNDKQIITDSSNQLSEYLFGESLNFTPDGWDSSGASISVTKTIAEGVNTIFTPSADVIWYKERQYQWAQKAITDAEIKISQLSNPASSEATAMRKASKVTAESLRNMGDRAASRAPNIAASTAILLSQWSEIRHAASEFLLSFEIKDIVI